MIDEQTKETILKDLREHNQACDTLLKIALEENEDLRFSRNPEQAERTSEKTKALENLSALVDRLRAHRVVLEQEGASGVRLHRTIAEELRAGQDRIMRYIALNKENENLMLKEGLVPSELMNLVGRQSHGAAALTYRNNTV